jgi:hypothetical protein
LQQNMHPKKPRSSFARLPAKAKLIFVILLLLQVLLVLRLFAYNELDVSNLSHHRQPWLYRRPSHFSEQQQRLSSYAEPPHSPVRVGSPVAPDDIESILGSCPPPSRPSFARFVNEQFRQGCSSPLSVREFICEAQCAAHEPELDRTVRILSLADHSFEWVVQHCRSGKALFMLWFTRNTGSSGPPVAMHFTPCIRSTASAFLRTRALFIQSFRVLFTTMCLVQIPSDFVLLFDPTDFATPTESAPRSPHAYMEPLPPTFRYVGTRAHAGVLFPTDSHVTGAHHCQMRMQSDWWQVCSKFSPQVRAEIPWASRGRKPFWRGLPTGTPWTNETWAHTQRSRLVREFGSRSDFNVGFTKDSKEWSLTMSREEAAAMRLSWAQKPEEERKQHLANKFLIHVDGHGASWGISHKLQSGSALLWVESSRDYREHFYPLLEPFEHYVPIAIDMADLHLVTKWLGSEQGDSEAAAIAQRAADLFETRLRAQDLHCYVMRALLSISKFQRKGPRATPALMRQALGQDFANFTHFDGLSDQFPVLHARRHFLQQGIVMGNLSQLPMGLRLGLADFFLS